MRICYIGCVVTSKVFLEVLLQNNANIVGVITKKESKFNADFVDLAPIAIENHIEYYYTENTNDCGTLSFISEKQPDIIFCFGWSHLLKKEILAIPSKGTIGFHPAKLPANKGRHPLVWAIALGLRETASTFFYMSEKADDGMIITQEDIEIEYEDYAHDLYDKVLKVAKKQVVQLLTLTNDTVKQTVPESVKLGNVWRKRGKLDGQIDWRMSSGAIYNLVRALSKPYIGAHFIYKNKEYKVWKAEEVITDRYKNIEPGKVIKVYSDKSFLIKAYDNLIKVIECDKIDLEEGEYL